MNSRLKNRAYINLGVITALLIIIIIFIIYPAITTIVSINRDISKEHSDLEKKASLGINIEQTQNDLLKIKGALVKMDDIFIKKNQELEFITKIENIATAVGVTVDINSDFIGQKISNSIRQIPLQINATGDYSNIIVFLNLLEAMPYYYNTNIIMISPKQQANKTMTVMQLTGQVYLKEN